MLNHYIISHLVLFLPLIGLLLIAGLCLLTRPAEAKGCECCMDQCSERERPTI